MTMSTGGVAIVLSRVPLRFRGLTELGVIVYIFNLLLFALNCLCISLRFWVYKWTLRASILHPTESLFVSCSVLSSATIVIGAQGYGAMAGFGEWFADMMRVLFWMYCGTVMVVTVVLHTVMWVCIRAWGGMG